MRFRRPENTKRHQQKRKHGVSRRQRQLYLSEWKELTVTNERRSKTASGYVSVKLITEVQTVPAVLIKPECIKGKQLQNTYGKAQ